MIPKEEFPNVNYLIETYFFQNWDEVYGTETSDVLEALTTQEKRAALVEIRDDLDRLLARGFSNHELREYVDGLGVGYFDENVGGLFCEIRDVLERHLAAS